MKKIALLMALITVLTFCSCKKDEKDDGNDSSDESFSESSDTGESTDESKETEGSSAESEDDKESDSTTSSENTSQDGSGGGENDYYTNEVDPSYNAGTVTTPEAYVPNGDDSPDWQYTTPGVTEQPPTQDDGSGLPPDVPIQNFNFKVTICAPVATGVYIIGGTCASDCAYMLVEGGASTEYIYPDYNNNGGYFLGQVRINGDCTVSIYQVYTDGSTSSALTRQLQYKWMNNLMESDDYMPVFGKNSRMHFYSSLLAYSLNDPLNDGIKSAARQNIANNVATANSVGAELIYLIVPSSAAVYPETVPDGYSEAWGTNMFQSFKSIAEECGATVVYPLDLFKSHTNDGTGYKIYHNTDSHWSTYGAYYGLSALCDVISQKFPAARARTVSEMGFYTKQMCGGDALFSFGDGAGFEDYSSNGDSGVTVKTKIKELTTLYSLATPTNTISDVYRGNVSVYVDGINSDRATVYNPSGSGLPTALVLRDSFGCTIYDMFNERFSTVYWQPSHVYNFPSDAVTEYSPDYVIYIVSERNIPKIMIEDENISLMNMVK